MTDCPDWCDSPLPPDDHVVHEAVLNWHRLDALVRADSYGPPLVDVTVTRADGIAASELVRSLVTQFTAGAVICLTVQPDQLVELGDEGD